MCVCNEHLTAASRVVIVLSCGVMYVVEIAVNSREDSSQRD